jgi:hypothetical protein
VDAVGWLWAGWCLGDGIDRVSCVRNATAW